MFPRLLFVSASHMERMLGLYRRTQRMRSPKQEKSQYEAREFTWYYDDDGMFVFQGRLMPEDGAALQQALEAVLDVLNQKQAANREAAAAPNQNEQAPAMVGDETFPRKRADALVLLAETALDRLNQEGAGGSVADKYQVMLHIEPDRSAPGNRNSEKHLCSLKNSNGHFPLSPNVARRLACDAGLVPLLEDEEGKVLNIGRKSRTVPPSIRRALTLRDKGCRFPGCCQSRFVDAHQPPP